MSRGVAAAARRTGGSVVLCAACACRFEAGRVRPGVEVRCPACDAAIVIGDLRVGRRKGRRSSQGRTRDADGHDRADRVPRRTALLVALRIAAFLLPVAAVLAAVNGLLGTPEPIGADGPYLDPQSYVESPLVR